MDFEGKQLTRFQRSSGGICHYTTLNSILITTSNIEVPQEHINFDESCNHHNKIYQVEWIVSIIK